MAIASALTVQGNAEQEIVQRLVGEALKTFRAQKAAPAWLASQGLYGKVKHGQPAPYSQSAISGWKNGRDVPDADVFLALVRHASLKLDPILYPATEPNPGAERSG